MSEPTATVTLARFGQVLSGAEGEEIIADGGEVIVTFSDSLCLILDPEAAVQVGKALIGAGLAGGRGE